MAALAGGFPFALMGGLRSVHPYLDKAVGPGVVLARDRRTFSAITLAVGIVGALAFGLVTVLEIAFGYPPDYSSSELAPGLAYGLAAGLTVGLMLALARSVWMQFQLARITLAAAGRVPWRFMSFLADAQERRGVLRQAGAVYQFRHLDLQRHLAQHQP
ncbi:hypothetical protein [Streptomyces sp. NPDC101165]|uniref:hypothetical protein n=1 Tax=Streptomyces sp. NPDC101165 TaxID=3366119 RepID=UPI0038274BF4